MLLALVLTASLSQEAPETPPPPEAGPQVGIIAVGQLLFSPDRFAAMTGAGVRFGLRPRNAEPMMFMPALALLAGGAIDNDRDGSGFVETRLELMGLRPGGLLQPTIHGYVSTGVSLGRSYLSPLRGVIGPVAARPYLSLGGGWNWNPSETRSGFGSFFSGGGWGAGIFVALALLPFVLDGRVEVRFTPAVNPDESSEVAFVTGFGF